MDRDKQRMKQAAMALLASTKHPTNPDPELPSRIVRAYQDTDMARCCRELADYYEGCGAALVTLTDGLRRIGADELHPYRPACVLETYPDDPPPLPGMTVTIAQVRVGTKVLVRTTVTRHADLVMRVWEVGHGGAGEVPEFVISWDAARARALLLGLDDYAALVKMRREGRWPSDE